jgi:epoxyqueuosine reductase
MKAGIAQRAHELGFDACRFTTAAPPQSAPQFQQWLATHQHGEMSYLQRNASKRMDPGQVLPGARSIICLAASYATIQPSASSAPGSGVVARYARFADYHDALGERLKTLTEFVNQLGGASTRSLWYVDTGPLLERDLAQRAGLGFIGKHTNLISRPLGNWIFLAEIITTLELEPDPPEKNRCGTCARCLEACPTHAIIGPFQLDARLCISYLTIELKGPIPVELRSAVGNRIYGCDDCQLYCPWNKFAQRASLPDFDPRHGLESASLVELFGWSEEQFLKNTEGSAIRRIGHARWLRNLAVGLGNAAASPSHRGDAAIVAALQARLEHEAPLVVEHVRWALEQHGYME